jgi:mannose-6-phosphate isomerase-like protein (cupin superfamily)
MTIMKSRRKFLQHSAGGLLSGLLAGSSIPVFAHQPMIKGVVKQPSEGETYYVRENTPITILVSKRTDNVTSASLCTEELMPGSGIPIHKHLHNDEFFYFNQGSGIFLLEDKEFEITAGTTAFVPRGTWHGVKNTGNSTIHLTFGFSPAGFEDFFRCIGTIKGTPFQRRTPEESRAIADAYGMVFT